MSGHIKILLCHLMHYVDIIRVRNSHTVLLPCGGGWITQTVTQNQACNCTPPKKYFRQDYNCVRWEKKERKKISIGSGVGAVIVKEDFFCIFILSLGEFCVTILYTLSCHVVWRKENYFGLA